MLIVLSMTSSLLHFSFFRFQISDFRFQISDFRFQTSDFRLHPSDFILQTTGIGFNKDKVRMAPGGVYPYYILFSPSSFIIHNS